MNKPEPPRHGKDPASQLPTQTTGAEDRLPTTPPAAIPGYAIVGELGRGGMGVVYEAQQQSPRRRVAVKVVRGGQFVDDQRVRMFQREADTLARLKHPNIGAIYESGRTEDGQHFFTMELVRGTTLTEYVENRSKGPAADGLKLRLTLFLQIADAVHYAHQRGVIHRDLKPSNIVVTQDSGEVKVLDFGLARITEGDLAATMTTEVGVIKGTLPYMSPEQARGNPQEIDVRADVYALGVILYELLTGQRPYDLDRKPVVEAVRIICEESPVSIRASVSGRNLDVDLETIVGKALEKDPERRYDSAAALAEDIRRHLDRQPILARPPSTTYQLRKFAQRNRALVGGIAATFLVLLAGVVVSTVLGLREANQRRAAEQAQDDLEKVVAFQADMLGGVDPQRMGHLLLEDLRSRVAASAGAPGASEAETAAALAALDRIVGTNTALRLIDQEILERAAQTVEADAELKPGIAARLYHSMGETYRELGLYDRAESHLQRAIAIRAGELGEAHPDTLQSRQELAWTTVQQGRYTEAEPQMLEILAALDRELGVEHPRALEHRALLANLHERQGRHVEAEALHRELLEARRRLFGEEHPSVASSKTMLANALTSQGRFDEAEGLYLDAIDFRRSQGGEDSASLLVAMNNLATVYLDQQRFDQAEALLQDVLERRRRVHGDEHTSTLNTLANLAEAHEGLGSLQDADALQRQALEIRTRVLGPTHPETLVSLRAMAHLAGALGRIDEQETLLRRTLAGQRGTLGNDHSQTVDTIRTLAIHLARQRRHPEAEPLLTEALATCRLTLGSESITTLETMSDLANERKKLERHDEAEALYLEALEGFDRLGERRPASIVAYNLACLAAVRGQSEAALEWLRGAVQAGFDFADWMGQDPELKSLHGDPQFDAIIELARAN